MSKIPKIDAPSSFIHKGDVGKIKTVPIIVAQGSPVAVSETDAEEAPHATVREIVRTKASPVNKSTVLFVALGAYILFSKYGGTPQSSMPVSAFQWMSVALGIAAFAVLADLASGGKMGAMRLLGL